jgi:hypothetical protein
MSMLMAYAAQMQQQQQQGSRVAPGAEVHVDDLGFHPPGAERPLLTDVSMLVPANSLGLVIGRSGSGKTTLLQARPMRMRAPRAQLACLLCSAHRYLAVTPGPGGPHGAILGQCAHATRAAGSSGQQRHWSGRRSG